MERAIGESWDFLHDAVCRNYDNLINKYLLIILLNDLKLKRKGTKEQKRERRKR
jgi:hypothetical protein